MGIPRDFDKFLATIDSSGKYSDYDTLYRCFKQVVLTAGTSAANAALNSAQGLGPLTMVLNPWISILKVGSIVSSTMTFYDLKAGSVASMQHYNCTCSNKLCNKIVVSTIDKREIYTIKKALVATAVFAPFYGAYAVGRNLYKYAKGTKGKDRKIYAKHLCAASKPKWARTVTSASRQNGKWKKTYDIKVVKKGCPKAQTIIANLLGELKVLNTSGYSLNFPKTAAAILSLTGWKEVYKALNP